MLYKCFEIGEGYVKKKEIIKINVNQNIKGLNSIKQNGEFT